MSHKVLAIITVLLVSTFACGGATVTKNEDPPAPPPEGVETAGANGVGFGVQDVWIFQRILHIDSEGVPHNILPSILEGAELDTARSVGLPDGSIFTPVINLPGSIADGEDSSNKTRPSISVIVGILKNDKAQTLMAFSTADLEQEYTNVDLDDFLVLDITAIPGLEDVQVGDTMLFDLMMAQTLRPEDPTKEKGLENLDVFIKRIKEGQFSTLGIQVEGQQDLQPALITGLEVEVREGSTELWTRAKAQIALEWGFVGGLTGAIGGPATMVGGLLVGYYGDAAWQLGKNLNDQLYDDDPPNFSIYVIDYGCTSEYGYAKVVILIDDVPPPAWTDWVNSEYSGLDMKSLVVDLADPIPSTVTRTNHQLTDKLPAIGRGSQPPNQSIIMMVAYADEIRNTGDEAASVTYKLQAADKRGRIASYSQAIRVPKRNCVEPMTLWGLVWNDRNADGIRQETEPGLAGITVRLFKDGLANPVGETKTQEGGRYEFKNVERDQYFIQVERPDGWAFAPRNKVSSLVLDEADSDVYSEGTSKEGLTDIFDLRRWPKVTEIWGADAGLIKLTPQSIPPTITPTPVETSSTFEGIYRYTFVVYSDPAGHESFVGMPAQVEVTVTVSGDQVSFQGPQPWVNVSGTIAQNGDFNASGTGTVAGFPGVHVSFTGTVSENSTIGQYSMGTQGGLPDSKAITYTVNGEKQPNDTTEPTVAPQTGEGATLFLETPAFCRAAPMADAEEEWSFVAGTSLPIVGRYENGWMLVQVDDPRTRTECCWMGAGTVLGDSSSIPLITNIPPGGSCP